MKKLKKFLCVALVILLLATSVPAVPIADLGFGITASALDANGSCGDNATYTFDSATGKLVIDGFGALYSEAFCENTDIKDVMIGDDITKISARAFDLCSNLENVNFGDNILEIDYFGFGDCKKLKIVVLPKNLLVIGDKAFEYCENLEKVIMNKNVATIDYQAFYDCYKLNSINIPKEVNYIGYNAFHDCYNLKDIYYEGSSDDWKKIEIDGGNEALYNATIHYNSLMPYECEHINVLAVSKIKPTCASNGVKAHYVCNDCRNIVMPDGDSYVIYNRDLTIPTLKHNFIDGICTLCGVSDICEHDIETIAYKNSTCTETGFKRHYKCAKCGALFNDREMTEPLAEVPVITLRPHAWDNGTETIKADCFNDGEIVYKCLTCGELKKEKVNRYEHIFSSDYTIDIEATCYREGEQSKHCLREGCTAKIDTVKIPMVDHELSEYESNGDATCENNGTKSRKCKVCTYKTSPIEDPGTALGHKYTNYVSDGNATCTVDGTQTAYCDNRCGMSDTIIEEAVGHDINPCCVEKVATCTEEGLIRYKCFSCDYTYTEIEPKKSHDLWDSKDIQPTCTDDGLVELYCSNCDYTYTKTIPATGHNYPDNWSVLVEPDCETKGINVKICLNCNDIITQKLPKAGHADKDGDSKCDTCNKEIIVTEPDEPIEPDTPDEPEVPEEKPCSCDCHAGGIKAFFFKLINFFAKIFDKSARVCECGKSH